MFYNKLYNNTPIFINNTNNIKTNNLTKINITTDQYNIQSTNYDQSTEFIYNAQVPTVIYLPLINEYNENMNMTIINSSSNSVTIKTQDNQLLFNSLYLPPSGSTEILLASNKYCKLIINKKNNFFSFILLL